MGFAPFLICPRLWYHLFSWSHQIRFPLCSPPAIQVGTARCISMDEGSASRERIAAVGDGIGKRAMAPFSWNTPARPHPLRVAQPALPLDAGAGRPPGNHMARIAPVAWFPAFSWLLQSGLKGQTRWTQSVRHGWSTPAPRWRFPGRWPRYSVSGFPSGRWPG